MNSCSVNYVYRSFDMKTHLSFLPNLAYFSCFILLVTWCIYLSLSYLKYTLMLPYLFLLSGLKFCFLYKKTWLVIKIIHHLMVFLVLLVSVLSFEIFNSEIWFLPSLRGIHRNDGNISPAGRIAIQSFCSPQCEYSNMVSLVTFCFKLLFTVNLCFKTASYFICFTFLLLTRFTYTERNLLYFIAEPDKCILIWQSWPFLE